MWQIIKGVSVLGKKEFQVSDGEIGARTCSHDFSTLKEAKDKLKKLEEVE